MFSCLAAASLSPQSERWPRRPFGAIFVILFAVTSFQHVFRLNMVIIISISASLAHVPYTEIRERTKGSDGIDAARSAISKKGSEEWSCAKRKCIKRVAEVHDQTLIDAKLVSLCSVIQRHFSYLAVIWIVKSFYSISKFNHLNTSCVKHEYNYPPPCYPYIPHWGIVSRKFNKKWRSHDQSGICA